MLLFTAQDIAACFESRDNSRGRAYQVEGHVKDIRVNKDGKEIIALVQGTRSTPYRVEIEIQKKGARLEMISSCSCPVGYMCKHGAAALYEAISQENRQHEKMHRLPAGTRRHKTGLSERTKYWLSNLDEMTSPPQRNEDERIVYLLTEMPGEVRKPLIVTPALQRKRKDGVWGQPRPQSFHQLSMLASYGNLFDSNDHAILNMASLSASGIRRASWSAPDDPTIINLFMEHLIATERAFADEGARLPLTQGPDLDGTLDWELLDEGSQRPCLSLPRNGVHLLLSASPWYVDMVTGETGKVRYPINTNMINLFLSLDVLENHEVAHVQKHLTQKIKTLPQPYSVTHRKTTTLKPKAQIFLSRITSLSSDQEGETEAVAFLNFSYDDFTIHPSAQNDYIQQKQKTDIALLPRTLKKEGELLKRLSDENLTVHPLASPTFAKDLDPRGMALVPQDDASPWFWLDFIENSIPRLKEEGFEIQIAPDFESEVVQLDNEDIDADFTQNGDWWFSLDLGITINGERVQLLPLLVSMIRSMRSMEDIEYLTNVKTCYAPLPDGRKVALPAERIKTILTTLVELFEDKSLGKDGDIRVSMDIAAAFMKLEGITRKRWLG
ncbi:MAG: SWIM zinc finger domain-containing protein, partial [Bdellovibrionales bacterium]